MDVGNARSCRDYIFCSYASLFILLNHLNSWNHTTVLRAPGFQVNKNISSSKAIHKHSQRYETPTALQPTEHKEPITAANVLGQ